MSKSVKKQKRPFLFLEYIPLRGNAWQTFFLVFLFKLGIFSLMLYFGWLQWDKGIWYDALMHMRETGLIPYLTDGSWLLGVSEYPVVFTYFLTLFLPFIETMGKDGFFFAWGIVQLCFDMGLFLLLWSMTQNKKRVLFIYALAPTILILSTSRFDLMPAFFLTLAIFLLHKQRDFLSGFFTSIAIFIKLYPIGFVSGIYKVILRRYYYILGFVVGAILLNWFVLYRPEALLFPFSLHGGFRVETIVGMLGLTGVRFMHGDLLMKILLVVFGLLALIKAKTSLGRSICFIIVLMITSKFLSPQWNIWLLPFFVFTTIPIWIVLLFEFLTIIEFPFIWTTSFKLTSYTFAPDKFDVSHPINILFIFLNVAHYLFLLYFYYYCLTDKKLVDTKIKGTLKEILE